MVRERETTFLLNSSVVGYDGIKRTLYLGGLECQTLVFLRSNQTANLRQPHVLLVKLSEHSQTGFVLWGTLGTSTFNITEVF